MFWVAEFLSDKTPQAVAVATTTTGGKAQMLSATTAAMGSKGHKPASKQSSVISATSAASLADSVSTVVAASVVRKPRTLNLPSITIQNAGQVHAEWPSSYTTWETWETQGFFSLAARSYKRPKQTAQRLMVEGASVGSTGDSDSESGSRLTSPAVLSKQDHGGRKGLFTKKKDKYSYLDYFGFVLVVKFDHCFEESDAYHLENADDSDHDSSSPGTPRHRLSTEDTPMASSSSPLLPNADDSDHDSSSPGTPRHRLSTEDTPMASSSSPLLPVTGSSTSCPGGTKKKAGRLQMALNILKSVRSDGHGGLDELEMMTLSESEIEKSQEDLSGGELSDSSANKRRRISFKNAARGLRLLTKARRKRAHEDSEDNA
uniref:Uncharacterized protein n=1 Tax=Romanomermis culicivorax TaxID=13658 RepID=A0A915HWL5_ROMCU